MFGVSCPVVDLTVGVQTAARAPFVSLFQVLVAEEEQRWNRSRDAREAKFVETCEGVQVKATNNIHTIFFTFEKHIFINKIILIFLFIFIHFSQYIYNFIEIIYCYLEYKFGILL